MKKLLAVVLCIVLTGCTTGPVDPFTASARPKVVSMHREKVRRDSAEISSRQAELIYVPHREMKNGKIRAIFYLSPEDKRLYPEADEKQLLDLDVVPNVAEIFSAGLKRMLSDKRSQIDVRDLDIFIPFPPPEVMRLSRRAYPIIIEGSPENMEKVAFRFAWENRMIRIYDLTIDAAGRPIDDRTMDRIRDIVGSAMLGY